MGVRLLSVGIFAAIVSAAACEPARSTSAKPAPAPSTSATASASATAPACTEPSPAPGYECMRACGPPIARRGDPEPPYRWFSPDQAASRRKFGCPICLPRTARIATPSGEVRIDRLHVGDAVFTADAAGRRIVGKIRAVASSPVAAHHRLVRVRLSDGRVLAASPGHPTATGRPLAEAAPGDVLDRARVVAVDDVELDDDATYDLLPDGDSGLYWADGVLVASTLRPR